MRRSRATRLLVLLALLVGSTAFASDEPVTVLYKSNPDIVSYEQLNP